MYSTQSLAICSDTGVSFQPCMAETTVPLNLSTARIERLKSTAMLLWALAQVRLPILPVLLYEPLAAATSRQD